MVAGVQLKWGSWFPSTEKDCYFCQSGDMDMMEVRKQDRKLVLKDRLEWAILSFLFFSFLSGSGGVKTVCLSVFQSGPPILKKLNPKNIYIINYIYFLVYM